MNIFRAVNGEEAVKLFLKNTDIKIVLMDIKMPIMNGLQATMEIRKHNKEVPVIAQTAYASSQDMQKAMEAGCTDFISKPVNKIELMSKINRVLKSDLKSTSS